MPRTTIINGKDHLNLTEVAFMCNSNIHFYYKHEYEQFKDRLKNKINDDLFGDSKSMDEVFGKEPFVDEVRRKAFAVEIGAKQRRGHFNFVVEIWHQVQKYSIPKLRIRLKEWLDKNIKESSGWNVFSRRLKESNKINYANKEERWKYNDEINQDDPEVERLSEEDKEIVELTTDMGKKVRILE